MLVSPEFSADGPDPTSSTPPSFDVHSHKKDFRSQVLKLECQYRGLETQMGGCGEEKKGLKFVKASFVKASKQERGIEEKHEEEVGQGE